MERKERNNNMPRVKTEYVSDNNCYATTSGASINATSADYIPYFGIEHLIDAHVIVGCSTSTSPIGTVNKSSSSSFTGSTESASSSRSTVPSSPKTITEESTSVYEESGRPKVYRLVELLEGHNGAAVEWNVLQKEYAARYGENISQPSKLGQILCANVRCSNKMMAFHNARPKVLKALFDGMSTYLISLEPNARDILDKHEWENGYNPQSSQLQGPQNGASADSSSISNTPSAVNVILTVGVIMHDWCNNKGGTAEICLDESDAAQMLPAELSKLYTPQMLLQMLVLFFFEDFHISYTPYGVYAVEAVTDRQKIVDKDALEIEMCLADLPKMFDICPAAKRNCSGNIYAVHFVSMQLEKCTFSVRFVEDDDEYMEMLHWLEKYVAILRADPDAPVQCPLPKWHYLHKKGNQLKRCRILEIANDTALVNFTDEGAEEIVQLTEILPLPEALQRFPPFSAPCVMEEANKTEFEKVMSKISELRQCQPEAKLLAQLVAEDVDQSGECIYVVNLFTRSTIGGNNIPL